MGSAFLEEMRRTITVNDTPKKQTGWGRQVGAQRGPEGNTWRWGTVCITSCLVNCGAERKDPSDSDPGSWVVSTTVASHDRVRAFVEEFRKCKPGVHYTTVFILIYCMSRVSTWS